jgi:hypothetical protein
MQHRPAAPAFVVAIVLLAIGGLLALFFLADNASVGVLGLIVIGLGAVAAVVGLLRLAVGVDYLTYRELEREAGRDFVFDPASDLTEYQQRLAIRQGGRATTHAERMARIREAAAASSE